MTHFKPFEFQRVGGPQTENPGYPGSKRRGLIREKYEEEGKSNVLGAINALSLINDDFLMHQYYLRDMAYVCLEEGDIDGAKKWLAKIGEDKK